MEQEILRIEERYLENVQAILETDLSPRVKALKIQSEHAKMVAKIDEEVMNYKIELHLNELPF